MIPNCAATPRALCARRLGPVYLDPPSLDLWPDVNWAPTPKEQARDLEHLTPPKWPVGNPANPAAQRQDADRTRRCAHKRIQDMLARARSCRWTSPTASSTASAPVDPVRDEVVGPARPTATRMDGFTEMMLAQTGLIAMVGKAERGPVAIEAIKKHKSAYLMAVGGAAYLVQKRSRPPRVVGFADLGMEAIYEFDVVDMPVTVAVDAGGTSAHITGPAEWQKIATGEFKNIAVTST